MKKSISFLLVLSIIAGVFAMCGVSAFATTTGEYNDLTYSISDGEVKIVRCSESASGKLEIPEEIEGYPVTSIGNAAFEFCMELTEIVVPDSVTLIDENAFYLCKKMKKITLSDNLTQLNHGLFYECYDLEDVVIPDNVVEIKGQVFDCCYALSEIAIPEGVTSIGGAAFSSTALKELNLPDSLTYIGTYAFSKCNNLVDVVLPDNLTYIDEYAFSECVNLESIILPESLLHIGSCAFNQCEKLKALYIPQNVEYVSCDALAGCVALECIDVDEKNEYYSSENNVLFDKQKSVLYRYPSGKTENRYSIPDGVERIAVDAFHVNTKIEYINIPDSVKIIEDIAFVHCTKLKELTIPDSVTSLGNTLLVYCLSLESLTLGANVDRFYAENALLTMSLNEVYVYNPEIVFDEKSIGYTMATTKAPFDQFVEIFSIWMVHPEQYNDYIEANMIWYDSPQPIEGFTIYGFEGSTAETYANENGFNFVALCRHNYVDTVITAPTYTQVGEGGMVCEHCGEVQSTYEIPMLEIDDSEEKKDKDTGVSVIFPEGTFDDDAEVEITPVEEGEAYKLISHKQGNYKVTMFDINVTVDGENVQPNGAVLVKIPLPKGYNQNKCVVYYVADDGTMEELKTYHHKDGYVYFETDHFSYYAVIDETEETSGGAAWMDESLRVIDRFIAFINAIIAWFKSIFGMA